MLTKLQASQLLSGSRLHLKRIGVAKTSPLIFSLLLLLLMNFTARSMQGQTYRVLYNFTGTGDGSNPTGLALSKSGVFYGVTNDYPGTVFSFLNDGMEWHLQTLYTFKGGNDAATPYSILIGPGDTLYGASYYGGNQRCTQGCGTVYEVACSQKSGIGSSCSWTESVLYRFAGGLDGATPGIGPMIFDRSGDLYGTTISSGKGGSGTVFRLFHTSAGWIKDDIHDLMFETEGSLPFGGVVSDAAGNLYGTASYGISGNGSVYEVMPFATLGSGWAEKTLHIFSGGADGSGPYSGVIFDNLGNLYGTAIGGYDSQGTVFMMSPSDDQWTFTTLYTFTGFDGANPYSGVVMDKYGNLYGTTLYGGGGCGTVFKLTHSQNGWKHTLLHAFTCGNDGYQPGPLLLHPNGKIYGTTNYGGTGGWGVIFEITP